MKIDIVTIFPEMFESATQSGVLSIAQKKSLLELNLVNLRDFTSDKHGQVDDLPYGGGPGMVMKAEPFFNAVEYLKKKGGAKEGRAKVIAFSPQGERFDQNMAYDMAKEKHLVLLCCRYEGVDERVKETLIDRDISMGDYVVSGAEYPAMLFADAVVRLLPGVLGDEESLLEESFSPGLLEYPQYTRPYDFRGLKVPDVLLSGDHEKIRLWRRAMMLKVTEQKRPDLFSRLTLSDEDKRLLEKFEKDN
ncbi:MAG: tRNA (guanosine(37)-N1)-methyltransferase TrmD [Actinomycetota bacterium]|nr:tRNA (guanosine(37)-N1)-methyltransferase TrmD [Actinomycetota bacterium]